MKKLIKKIFNVAGLEVYRLQPHSDPGIQILAGMKKVQTNIILDIGANTGQFASEMRRKGYEGKIVSFEPLEGARKKLLQHSSKDANWIVHEKTAIGDNNGFIDINVARNSVSSSILDMLDAHSDAETNSTSSELAVSFIFRPRFACSLKSCLTSANFLFSISLDCLSCSFF